jgi:hypothetical protein
VQVSVVMKADFQPIRRFDHWLSPSLHLHQRVVIVAGTKQPKPNRVACVGLANDTRISQMKPGGSRWKEAADCFVRDYNKLGINCANGAGGLIAQFVRSPATPAGGCGLPNGTGRSVMRSLRQGRAQEDTDTEAKPSRLAPKVGEPYRRESRHPESYLS